VQATAALNNEEARKRKKKHKKLLATLEEIYGGKLDTRSKISEVFDKF